MRSRSMSSEEGLCLEGQRDCVWNGNRMEVCTVWEGKNVVQLRYESHVGSRESEREHPVKGAYPKPVHMLADSVCNTNRVATRRLDLSSFSNLLKAARTKTLYLGLRTLLPWQSERRNVTIGQIMPRSPELHEHQATLLNVPQHLAKRAWVVQLYLHIRLDFILLCF